MHPAFSVIFFTTLSGLGYGIWMWAGLALVRPMGPHESTLAAWLVLSAFVPVAAGLLSSTLHLGQPLRSWRAFSQWRTSWLSREGVMAIVTFVPWALIACAVAFDPPMLERMPRWAFAVAVGLLALLSLVTVVCTAMIYASLKPIPAWRHRGVVPAYIGFALLTGGLVAISALATVSSDQQVPALVLLGLAIALLVLKRRYWRDIDHAPLPVDRASALGLPADRVATVFERPHTEASYLTKEMGFVVARKHSRKLRRLASALFGVVPALACAGVLVWPPLAAPVLAVAAASALLGAIVERWLFFAEAKHLVTLYY